jgi:hypothetical protein
MNGIIAQISAKKDSPQIFYKRGDDDLGALTHISHFPLNSQNLPGRCPGVQSNSA